MKRRTVKKQFWFSRDEAQDLQKKAKKTCLTEAALQHQSACGTGELTQLCRCTETSEGSRALA